MSDDIQHESLQERWLASLHKNSDGHLASDAQAHRHAVQSSHNVAVVYFWQQIEWEGSTVAVLHHEYIHSAQPLPYQDWLARVRHARNTLAVHEWPGFMGFQGWLTQKLKITPLRNNDLLIKIDEKGARGVRITFSRRAYTDETRSADKKTRGKRTCRSGV